jgi:hypothetical protein
MYCDIARHDDLERGGDAAMMLRQIDAGLFGQLGQLLTESGAVFGFGGHAAVVAGKAGIGQARQSIGFPISNHEILCNSTTETV